MVFLEYLKWDLIAIVTLFVLAFYYTAQAHKHNRLLSKRLDNQIAENRAMKDDVKALFESANNLGIALKKIQHGTQVLKEQQEQLTLKEPNQQAYRNAIQAIENGETINKVSETSGLSRGEVELLKMFQKYGVNSTASDERKEEVAS